jgi:hypothetical protein
VENSLKKWHFFKINVTFLLTIIHARDIIDIQKRNERRKEMAIIQQYHKDTNTTYVYDSQSYWDPLKGQSRSKRKCIGKIDPVTGQMVPTGKQGRKKKEGTEKVSEDEINQYKALYEQSQKEILCLKAEISEQKKTISDLTKQTEQLQAVLNKIGKLISDR